MVNKAGKSWSKQDENTLIKMASAKKTTKEIALTLQRTEPAIRSKASQLGKTLMPRD